MLRFGDVSFRFRQRCGGYDRNVFEPSAVFEQIEFIRNNPARRGLNAKLEDWAWSGVVHLCGG